ncbi:hypothetical protein TI04_01535 [Achromatium sp. WMS2]|nr:hypothetical protein TI04_01535 [Achromatium sp. WMS2]
MSCLLTNEKGEQLLDWLTQTPGSELIVRESEYIEGLINNLYGCYLLQVGWGRIFHMSEIKRSIRKRIVIEECFPLMGGTGKILAKSTNLPIISGSMDVVFLPHSLEFSVDPVQTLLEAKRVLIPGGYLILLGFNPWGLWSLSRMLHCCNSDMPWCGKFRSRNWVMNWLNMHGFQVEQYHDFMFLPLLKSRASLQRWQYFEAQLKFYLPMQGAAYVICAVKRASMIMPLPNIDNYGIIPVNI